MKIIGLRIDGIRKLSAVEMEFADKGLIEIRGKNRQGKTSIIDSLEILLKGNKYIETDMIAHDKDRAEIIGYIDQYEIKRVITEKTNRLEIKNKEGFTIKEKPQAFLDKLVNALTFNPRPFLDKTPSEKLKFMMDLMEIDFTELNGKIDKQETERLLVGREIKAIGDIKPVEKAEKVSISELLTTRDKWSASNKAQEILQEHIVNRNNLIAKHKKEIEDLKKTIADLEEGVSSMGEPLPAINLDTINNQINNAEQANLQAGIYGNYLERKTEKQNKERDYNTLSNKIKTLRNLKKSKLKGVKTPVEGLEIREEGIFYNNVFSENWGESEALRISAELCIGMDPKLRAIFIDKGEAYDINSLKDLQAWAIENDLQAVITIVDSTGGTSEGDVYYLEEGKVV